ncbi:MAG: mechanosensitive ion channel family protein [Sandaracinaceae bacterium]|nr:mechanosensitive ion channel family protein [Sandaracinaceae bacterium]
MRRSLLLASAFSLALCAGLPSARAQEEIVPPGTADCSTPRRALSSWLGNLQPGAIHPRQSARCFDWAGARIHDHEEQETLAHKLKRVLDARGHYVVMDDVPDEPVVEGGRFVPFPNTLGAFVLVRRGESWVVSADTIRRIRGWHAQTFAFDFESLIAEGPPWLQQRMFGAAAWQYLGLLVFVLIGLLLRLVVSWVIRAQGARVFAHVVKELDEALLRGVARPVGTTAMVVFLLYAVPSMHFSVEINRFLIFGLRVAAAISGVFIVYRLVDVGAGVFSKRALATDTKLDDQLVPLIRKSLKVVTVILGVVFVLQNMEVEIGSLIAGVSIGGLAFTLAAQNTISNLFGSVSIFADQPFQVGDAVKIDNIEGTVEEVGMRSTRVRTYYRSLVSIPNSKVADGVIDNFGMRNVRRTMITLGVQYDTTPEQIEAFCQGVRAILAANRRVWKESYNACFDGFGDSGLQILVLFFLEVRTRDEELRERHLIFLEVLRLAHALGVQFAFPTRTLHVTTRATERDVEPTAEPGADELTATVLAFGPGGALSRPGGPELTHGFWSASSAAVLTPATPPEDPSAGSTR